MRCKTSKKGRRHSGRITPRISFKINRDELINECFEPQIIWDDWHDYRDGMRGCDDRKQIRNKYIFATDIFNVKRWNKKLKLLIARRKARKCKSWMVV